MIPNCKQNVKENEIYYKSGDIVKLGSDELNTSGFITSSGTVLMFNIVFPKSLDKISNINISSLTLNVRVPTGGYLLGSSTDFVNYISQIKKVNSNTIKLVLTNSAGWGQTNNIPVSVSSQNYCIIELI